MEGSTALSSMSSVISSIENDRQVFRWFLTLISLPAVQQKSSANSKTKTLYQELKKIQIAKMISFLVLALIIISSCLIKLPWIWLAGIFPLVVIAKLFQKNRTCVAAISEQFLIDNIQPGELTQQTLYQTCEKLSRIYNIPSLVDLICHQDFTGRKVLVGAIFFIPFIFRLETWQLLAVTLILYTVILALISSSIILRNLK